MFMPLFFEGKRRAFAVVICHHTDVGGRVPGSNASDSTEIYQEGLRIPPLKLYDRGVLNDDAGDADQDQRARAGPRVGRSVRAVCRRAGRQARPGEAVRSATAPTRSRPTCSELLDYAERLTRAEIKTWPKGRYEFTDHIDSDGFSDTPIPIKAAITVRDDGTLLVDYTGSSPAGEGRAQLDAQLHALADLSQRALRAAEGRAQQRRRVPLHRGEGAGGLRAQSGDAGAVRRARAHRLSRVRHHAGRAGADRARARAGGRRGRQQRDLHQRAAGPTASPSSSST